MSHESAQHPDDVTADAGLTAPPDDEVRRRAYELYMARGAVDGDDVADWMAAERELTARLRAGTDDVGEEAGERDGRR
jgi:hypothetical protein